MDTTNINLWTMSVNKGKKKVKFRILGIGFDMTMLPI